MPGVHEIAAGVSYHLMKEDTEPMWEHAGNVSGGTWRMKIPKKDTARVWQEMLLAVIGEQFGDVIVPDDSIVGLSVTCRENDDLLQVWNSQSKFADQETKNLYEKIDSLLSSEPVNFLARFYKVNQ